MLKKIFLFSVGLLLSFYSNAQDKYTINLNIKKIKKDRIKIVMMTPSIKEDSAYYVMPSVIPGSYSKKDYGRFVSGFTALDKKGTKLKVTKRGPNVFVISGAKNLSSVKYTVDDTWDVPKNDDYIFQPGGTNIEANKNVVLNHHGFYGYFEGYKMMPYEINITKPETFYGETSLNINRISATEDKLFATDYVRLVDAPVMYCKPDTASFLSGNAKISISVYSQTGIVKAEQLMKILTPLGQAMANFFVNMPVNHYHFLFYFPEYKETAITRYGGYGALEHSYSSFYFLPEMTLEAQLKSMVLGVASHEFLHILTPLNIHSEEIEYFDFREPKMSQHLWLYEGCTEYFSNLIQVREGLMTYENFIKQMNNKIKHADEFPNVSFTEMSKNILTDQYKDMYGNVYEKGALIGFLLDIRLRDLTGGKWNLRELMLQLSNKYGPNKPFKDDMLFTEITNMTHPDIMQFFTDYVSGNQPMPYSEYLSKIGWLYVDAVTDTTISFGEIGFIYDEKKKQFLANKTEKGNNAFDLEDGDIILAINGTPVSMKNYVELLTPLVNVTDLSTIKMEYQRNGEKFTKEAAPREFQQVTRHILRNISEPDDQQRALRNEMFNLK